MPKNRVKTALFVRFGDFLKRPSIGVHFLLISALVFDERRIIFSITGVLFFIEWVHPASVFFVAMGMVDLYFAFFLKTLRQLRDGIGYSNVQIESIDRMRYA